MGKKVIFHIDVNSAFLSWEAVYRIRHLGETSDLRDIPSAVGGDISKRHGIILAKSIPAKKYGIQTGEPVVDALRKCPGLVLVPPNREWYKTCSDAFMKILRNYSDAVEQFSIDEAFVDMTGTRELFGEPVLAANRLKDEIFQKLGFTVNVGISSNKLLAKMASDFQKPNLAHTLFPEEIEEKMWPLPVRDLFSVGKASETKLRDLGIRTIGDLARTDIGVLKSALKKHGEEIWNFANGRDDSAVEPVPADNKGYGNSTTLSSDVADAETAKKILLSLSETVGRRLRKDRAWAEEVAVSIRYYDFTEASHQRALRAATNITQEIHEAASRLFDELWDGRAIRLLGVRAGRVTKDGNRQLHLFDSIDPALSGEKQAGDPRFQYEKLEKLDQAIDSIRERFGAGSVMRASLLRPTPAESGRKGTFQEKGSTDGGSKQE